MKRHRHRKDMRPNLKKLAKFIDKRMHDAPPERVVDFLESMCLEFREFGEMPVDAAAIQAETDWPMEWAATVFDIWAEYRANGGD